MSHSYPKIIFRLPEIKKAFIALFIIPICISGSQACSDDPIEQPPDLRTQIARMLMVGVRGTGPELNEEMKMLVSDLGVGGIILYEYDAISGTRPRNISSFDQVKQLVTNLREASRQPLLIGIDQEGGKVSRLKPQYGFPPTVTAQYLGTLNNPDSTAFYASRTAEMVKSTGINFNFAPVVDLNTNPECPVIGKLGRSFSANPDVVVNCASIFYTHQKNAGILTTYKHFPGHGSSTTDSHAGFTDVTQTWKPIELEPYSQLIANGLCDAIMTAHVYNAHLDSVFPATLSKKVLTRILRDSLHFNGVIVSDDMMMGAITQNWSLETALLKAIDAGVDLLIFSNNVSVYNPQIARQAIDLVEKMVTDGTIPPARIAESYNRLTALQRKIETRRNLEQSNIKNTGFVHCKVLQVVHDIGMASVSACFATNMQSNSYNPGENIYKSFFHCESDESKYPYASQLHSKNSTEIKQQMWLLSTELVNCTLKS